MISAHLGIVKEEQINDMSFVFFEDVLAELNYKLTFDAIANYAGNSFFEKSWDMIQEHHPFLVGGKAGNGKAGNNAVLQKLSALLNK